MEWHDPQAFDLDSYPEFPRIIPTNVTFGRGYCRAPRPSGYSYYSIFCAFDLCNDIGMLFSMSLFDHTSRCNFSPISECDWYSSMLSNSHRAKKCNWIDATCWEWTRTFCRYFNCCICCFLSRRLRHLQDVGSKMFNSDAWRRITKLTVSYQPETNFHNNLLALIVINTMRTRYLSSITAMYFTSHGTISVQFFRKTFIVWKGLTVAFNLLLLLTPQLPKKWMS